jgi:anti-sigma regulatory factor (Ser/Thr protein kinase)
MKATRHFENAPESVPAARRFAMDALTGIGRDTLDAVELMVSELVTNCIRHTASEFDLTITRTQGEIFVEATDAGRESPRLRDPGPNDPSGRGLRIVDLLATSWGIRMAQNSKTVWLCITLGA